MFIFLGKRISKIVPSSFDFSSKYFLLGASIAVSCAIALINWQIEDRPIPYEIKDMDSEVMVMDMPVTFQKDKPKDTPPPVKPKKVVKLLDLMKLNLVKDLVETKEETLDPEPVADDFPAPVAIDSVAAPIVAPMIVEPEEKPFELRAEQMPRFPGCEDMDGSNKEKESCSQKALFQYIAGNLKYPSIARTNGIEGLVVVRFIVSKTGKITDLKILSDIGAGCGKAALEVVESMNELPDSWTPGKQRGRPVNVQYTLPVKFKLN